MFGVPFYKMPHKVGIARKVGFVALAVVCSLSFACAREIEVSSPEPPSKEPVDRARGGTTMPEPPQTVMGEPTLAEGDAAILAGGRPPPEYEVRGEGTLIIGGDVVVSCRDVGSWAGPPSATRSAKQQLREEQRDQARACTKAGFPPEKAPR